jgi:Acyclic terpene utilisation family protein AtuA
LIECGPYATGANFSGFKEYLPSLVDLAFPIAEILPSGESFITKPDGWAGTVNKFNITAQLLYELQGELYLNPDVVANLSEVDIQTTSQVDRVFVSGVVGYPPPPTTKVMIAAQAGFQAETTYYINGLDVTEKAELMKRQLSHIFRDSKFSKLSVEVYGSESANPKSQAAGTVMLRVFAQSRKRSDISADKFKKPIYSLRMQSYPGKDLLMTSLQDETDQNRISHEPRLSHDGSKTLYGNVSSFNRCLGD